MAISEKIHDEVISLPISPHHTEEQIKKSLKVINFTDYRDKKEELKVELKKYFTNIRANKYSELIAGRSKKYHELFSTLGIDFN